MMEYIRAIVTVPTMLVLPVGLLCLFIDEEIIYLVRFLHHPSLDSFANFLSSMTSFVGVFVFAAGWFLEEIQHIRLLKPVLVAGAVGFALSYGIKWLVGRARPYGNSGTFGFSDSSFPSSHATVAFACASTLGMILPRESSSFFTFAFLTSLSRLYLGKHYLSDLMLGAILGNHIAKQTMRSYS